MLLRFFIPLMDRMHMVSSVLLPTPLRLPPIRHMVDIDTRVGAWVMLILWVRVRPCTRGTACDRRRDVLFTQGKKTFSPNNGHRPPAFLEEPACSLM
jgi:hypothetical protein